MTAARHAQAMHAEEFQIVRAPPFLLLLARLDNTFCKITTEYSFMQNTSAKMQSIGWDDIRYFLAVARSHSVSRAAKELAVNYTTVSRRISSLETRVGSRLFERLSTGHVLTAAGELILPRAVAMEEQSATLQRSIMGQDAKLRGRLRLASGDVMLTHLIVPQIERFTRVYPDIELEILSSDQNVDLRLMEADIAVRATRLEPPPGLVGINIGRLKFGLYASRDYLRKRPDLNTTRTTAVLWDEEGRNPQWLQNTYPNATIGPTFDTTAVMLQALKSGLGIGGLVNFVAAQEADLQMIAEHSDNAPHISMWILHHPDLRTTAKVRVFRDFLKTILLEQRELIVASSSD